MRKGTRPSKHIRRVGKRKLPKLINPSIAKKIPNKKYKIIMKKKLGPNADADGDGVKNKNDCFPFDKKKQHDFGSVEWQDEMQKKVINKRIKGEHLSPAENAFDSVQRENTQKRIYFIKEPYGLPFELTEAGKFTELKRKKR